MNSPKLSITATTEEILANLNLFKIYALNYAVDTMTNENSQHLEPREVKQLTDIVLSLEDSISVEDTEGKQARTVQRLLSRYTSDSEGKVVVKSMEVKSYD